jgi:hypothetical protein
MPGFPPDHFRRDGAARQKNRFQIGIQDGTPICLGVLLERAKKSNSGVIHENIDRPERTLRLGDQAGYLVSTGDIRSQGQYLDACREQIRGHTFKICRVPRANGHSRTHLTQAARYRQADPAAGSSYKRNLPFEHSFAIHRISLGGKWYPSAGFLLPEKRILSPAGMAWIQTRHAVLRRASHEGMLLAPFGGIPYNPRDFNRQLSLEPDSVFILAL